MTSPRTTSLEPAVARLAVLGGGLGLVLILVLALGCDRSVPAGGGWLAELPSSELTLAPGDRVWCALPVEGVEAVRWQVLSHRLVDGASVLVDDLGVEHGDVPPALLRPVAEPPAPGSVVVAYHGAAGLVVGELIATDGAQPVVAFDWNGTPVEDAVAAVHAVTGEASALEPVAFRDGETWTLGWVVAVDGERAWAADAAGRVTALPVGELHVLDGLGRDRAAGDAVLAFTWADGFRPATVEAVVEGGYRVVLDSGEARRLPAMSLVDASPAWFG